MTDRLAGVDLKLTESDKRLALLDEQAIALLNIEGDPLVGHLDPATGDYVLRYAGELPPLSVGLEVGLWAHLLRSALDNMLWQLVKARLGTPTNHHQFPIYEESAEFGGKSHRTTKARWETDGITDDDFAFIEGHQPFQRGTDRAKWHPLALLAHLNNMDKHRYVHPQFALISSGAVSVQTPVPRGYFWPRLLDEERAGSIRILEMAFAYGGDSIDLGGSEDDPAEVARISGNLRPNPHVHVDPGRTLDISFSDRERPVSEEDLYDIRMEVDEIINYFRPVIG